MFIAKKTTRGLFLVCGCFLRQVLGVCSIRIFAKNMGDPYMNPLQGVGHDITIIV